MCNPFLSGRFIDRNAVIAIPRLKTAIANLFCQKWTEAILCRENGSSAFKGLTTFYRGTARLSSKPLRLIPSILVPVLKNDNVSYEA